MDCTNWLAQTLRYVFSVDLFSTGLYFSNNGYVFCSFGAVLNFRNILSKLIISHGKTYDLNKTVVRSIESKVSGDRTSSIASQLLESSKHCQML